ncbi:TonB-dependent receptor [Ekhidna sp.]
MKRLFITFACLTIGYAYGQVEKPLSEYLEQLEASTDKSFFYQKEWIDSISVKNTDNEDYLNVIRNALSKSGFLLNVRDDRYVFIYPNKLELERKEIVRSNSRGSKLIENIRIGNPNALSTDSDHVLSGIVTDEFNEPLIGVNISVDGRLVSKSGTDGGYNIGLKSGNYTVEFSYIGLEKETRLVTLYSSGNLSISLFSDSRILDEVVVEQDASSNNNLGPAIGIQRIGIDKLEKLASVTGDIDVVKSMTTLPGVTVSGESSSYLNIRGGSNDQTLVQMNNTTIFNPGHLLGFFSVFNGDFVSDVSILKGNIPAKYGIRASSVLDVKMNKWAKKKLNVYGGLGIVNSNLGLKAKALDDKLDIHVGGRISYINWILDFVPDKDILQSSAQFGDVNLSSRYRIDDKNSIFLSSYYGEDFFRFSDKIIYRWSSLNNQLKWTRVLSDEWILESEIASSILRNNSENLIINDEFEFENGISELSFKSLLSSEKIIAGIDVTKFDIALGNVVPTTNNSLVQEKSIDEEDVLNLGAHASYLIKVSDNFEISTGLRFNYFMNLGNSRINIYENGAPFTQENVIGQEVIDEGDVNYSKYTLEPRIGLEYKVSNNSINAGYSRVNQFLHLISNTVLVNPSTVWKSSDRFIPPTQIDQFSIGYTHNLVEQDISISIDGFYKIMNDLVDYRNGAELVLNENLEQATLRGEGESYGIEFLVSKEQGFLSGIASYTYSRTFITVDDQLQGVQINDGERYPFYSDRPHNFKATLDFKLSKKWTVSSNFTYLTGAPINAPVNVFQVDGVRVPYFSSRNSSRIPDYHRLDLVVSLKSRIRKTKKNNDRWVFALYNVYGRDNVATIFFSSENNAPSQPFALVNVGRMIPTITYKFEF